jgi:ornithine cyclodeaminase/alanine dehydrogenase-like protein (mu-crystallin family)
MLILNEMELRLLLNMREVIEAVEMGFRLLGTGRIRAPERLRLSLPELSGTMLEMPAALLPSPGGEFSAAMPGALGTKIVSVFPGNSNRGLGAVQSVYLLLDPATGVPLCIMDGNFITGIRTAAASAVATKHMSPAGPKTVAIFGAGVQARFHVEAMREVASVQRVIISSRSLAAAQTLANEIASQNGASGARDQSPPQGPQGIDVEVADSPESAARRANMICTCTTSAVPLFDGALIQAGTHLNAVGAFTPPNARARFKTNAAGQSHH